MGFDLSGLNPNVSRPEPELPPFTERTDDDWGTYHAWQEENCGVYFRNNVWWWSPLWSYVCSVCYNILSDKDIEQGSWNDGHKISKTKADKIAERLRKCLKDGHVELTEAKYKLEQELLPDVDCEICDATGKRQEPPKTGAGDVECNGCNGTGKKDDWNKSYPFTTDNVREFANFCANSGGFTIC